MSSTPVPGKHDVAALWFAIVIGAGVAVYTVVQAVPRIAEVAYVGTATLVGAVGWVVVWMFRTMGANGAAAALAGERPVNTPFEIEPIVFFAVGSLGALTAAFQIGHRLQRDAEGLV